MPGLLRKIGLIAGLAGFFAGAASAQVEHRVSSQATQDRLAAIIAGDQRSEAHKARDKYRHPFETLSFFGIEPEMTVVEIFPGGQGGWYRKIIEPLIGGEGTYIPINKRFKDDLDEIPYGEVDMVLVLRAHGFVHPRTPEGAQVYIDAIHRMLKPGGLFGIVDHAGDEHRPQDPRGIDGYVKESYVFEAAMKAGFRILAASDVNRNPKDTKDHPAGVYSLPPTLSAESEDTGRPITKWQVGSEDYIKYTAIGESDRFTHLYYKPDPER